MAQLLRDNRYLAFWLGQVTSVVGTALSFVALPALILPARGPQAFALILAAEAVAGVLLLLAGGVVADRYSRTAVMAVSDVVRVAGVAGLLAFGARGQLWLPLVAACLLGIGSALYDPAHRAALPQLVPEELRQKANALDSATKRFGAAGGALLGAALVTAVGPQDALLIDLATFAVSLGTLLWVRLPRVSGGEPARGVRAMLGEAAAGVREVRLRPWALVIMVQGTVQVFFLFGPNFALLPIVSLERYGPAAFGWLSAATSVGMIIGSATASRIRTTRPGLWAMNVLLPCALLPVCLAMPVPLALWCAVQVVAWTGIGIFFVLWFTALQREFPAEVQGRVFALESLGNFALQPVAIAVAPLLALGVGMPVFAAVAVVALLVSTYAVFAVPGVDRLRTPERAAPAVPAVTGG
ncbi:MFS transporter [Catellatospora citrea]|uniref:MFS transporter n=1 Tax=Catellatospora citrea TaxID=53366 RepID=A0A8J3KVC7_9ACTN|nr:MFS transporter [Catellatospora citrea]RKE06429.1 MFS transporter [Catellatospora citrea]GIG02590.1 MFS transporter [Catellatospora citrea]